EKEKLKSQIHTVPVLKGADGLLADFSQWNVPTEKIIMHPDYHFSGYAKTKPELIDFIKKFVSSTGIMVEPSYTGKLLYAIYDHMEKDYFKPKSKILVIHTGGITGLLGYLDLFNK